VITGMEWCCKAKRSSPSPPYATAGQPQSEYQKPVRKQSAIRLPLHWRLFHSLSPPSASLSTGASSILSVRHPPPSPLAPLPFSQSAIRLPLHWRLFHSICPPSASLSTGASSIFCPPSASSSTGASSILSVRGTTRTRDRRLCITVCMNSSCCMACGCCVALVSDVRLALRRFKTVGLERAARLMAKGGC